MSYDADILADRRKLRRSLSIWRVLAFFAILIALFAGLAAVSDGLVLPRAHVAKVEINGVITGDESRLKLLSDIANDSNAKALLIDIDSPGGTTAGSEALYLALREVAEKKPVVATLGTLAASGGYIAAIGADHIVARRNTLAGSIGVIFQWPDAVRLLDRSGIAFNQVKSSPIKAEPTPFTETPEAAREMLEALVADSYDWFISLVRDRREMTAAEAEIVGDARVFTGKDALERKLIDAIGGETEARAWLAAEREINADLRIRTYRPRQEFESLGARLTSGVARALGLEEAANAVLPETLRLDGLISVWHPQLAQ